MTLKIKSLDKAFNKQPVLQGFELNLQPNAIHLLVGTSGAGKSTLLRLIAGLDRPDTGSIEWQGKTYASSSVWVPPWKRDVAFQFQDFGLWGHLSAKKHITTVGNHRANDWPFETPMWEYLLDMVELFDLANHLPGELSGGQQQRLSLARALASGKNLILLDEPTANLDGELAKRIWQKLKLLREEMGFTLLISTHDESGVFNDIDTTVNIQRIGEKIKTR